MMENEQPAKRFTNHRCFKDWWESVGKAIVAEPEMLCRMAWLEALCLAAGIGIEDGEAKEEGFIDVEEAFIPPSVFARERELEEELSEIKKAWRRFKKDMDAAFYNDDCMPRLVDNAMHEFALMAGLG